MKSKRLFVALDFNDTFLALICADNLDEAKKLYVAEKFAIVSSTYCYRKDSAILIDDGKIAMNSV